jgi:hypothetical protein
MISWFKSVLGFGIWDFLGIWDLELGSGENIILDLRSNLNQIK